MSQSPQGEFDNPAALQTSLPAIEFTEAPPAKSAHRAIWVIVAGLITTALSLVGVYALDRFGDVNVMGWYGDYIFPVGAILVGVAASSGYAFVSWKLGVKIRKGLLVIILLLLLGSYFAAEYAAFASRGPLVFKTDNNTDRPLGFWEYFHLKAVNWTWKKDNGEKGDSEPLGMAGYFFVGLGILGFSLSGLIIPAALARKPYCENCEQYMRARRINLWPAVALPPDKTTAKFEEADTRLQRVLTAAANNDLAAFQAERQTPAEMKAAEKQPRRLHLNLIQCDTCYNGYLEPVWHTGKGKQLQKTKLPAQQLSQDFGRQIQSIA